MHLKERWCRDVPVYDLTLVADWSHVARLSFCPTSLLPSISTSAGRTQAKDFFIEKSKTRERFAYQRTLTFFHIDS